MFAIQQANEYKQFLCLRNKALCIKRLGVPIKG